MHADDIELINAIAAKISPEHFDDRPVLTQAVSGGWIEDAAQTRTLRTINDAGKERARDIAIEVIAMVRQASRE